MKRLATIGAMLLLILIAGCYTVLVSAIPAIYLSKEIGIEQAPVEFTRTELSVAIDAPVEVVWNEFVDLENFPTFFPWVDEYKPKGEIERFEKIGDGIEYFVSRGTAVSKGAAIITKIEPKHEVMFTLFATYRGSQEFLFTPIATGTDLTYVSYIELIPPEEDQKIDKEAILRAREDNVRTTLSAVKGLVEGTLPAMEAGAKKRAIPLAGNVRRIQEAADIQVTRGVVEIDAPPEQVWDNFIQTKNLPRFFNWLYEVEPLGGRERFEKQGDGVQYRGPRGGSGTAVVTRIDPGKELYLSLFSPIRGGQEFFFEPLEGGRTRMVYVSYMEIPARIKGEKVEKEKILAQIRNQCDATLKAIKAYNEGGGAMEEL